MSASTIQSLIVSAAEQYGVNPSLALAVAQEESGFNQDAISAAGAIGVMQLMPSTAAQLGVNPDDTQQNIQGGVMYLAQLLQTFSGNVALAVGAYNAGPGEVESLTAAYGANWLSYAPPETRQYVPAVLAIAGLPAGASGLASSPISTTELLIGGAAVLVSVLLLDLL